MNSKILGENEKEIPFTWEDNGDIIRKIGREDNYITFVNKEGKKVRISLLDLSSMGDLEHDYIIEILNELLGVSVTSQEGLAKVNSLAQKSYEYLQDNLLYTDKELRQIGNIHFSSSQEIVRFLQSTKKSNGLKKCILTKVARAYIDGVSLDVEEKRRKTEDVLDNKIFGNLRDLSAESSMSYEGYEKPLKAMKDTGKSSMKGSIYIDSCNGNLKKIEFSIEFREKTLESTVSKSLREKDYINQGKIMDLLGVRIMCESKEDTLYVMNFLSQIAFKYGEYRIKNKGGISPADLKKVPFMENTGTNNFLENLEKSFEAIEKRSNTAAGYSDIKIVPIGEGNKLSFEIMFLEYDSSSHNGLSHHVCFEYKRKISERIRLDGFITGEGICAVSNALIDKISSEKMINLQGKKPTDLLKEILIDIIMETKGEGCFSKVFDSMEVKSLFGNKNTSLIEIKEHIEGRVKSKNKQELEKILNQVLPDFYKMQLIPFADMQGQVSKGRKKYTNSIGLENISVLSGEGEYVRLA